MLPKNIFDDPRSVAVSCIWLSVVASESRQQVLTPTILPYDRNFASFVNRDLLVDLKESNDTARMRFTTFSMLIAGGAIVAAFKDTSPYLLFSTSEYYFPPNNEDRI